MGDAARARRFIRDRKMTGGAKRRDRRRPVTLSMAGLLWLMGCTVGPDYVRPPAPIPYAFKEVAGWKFGAPADQFDRGEWWSIYRDPVLDSLERQIDVSNETLKSVEAAYRLSEAIVYQARAGLFPILTGNTGGVRNGTGGGSTATARSSYTLQGGASWDLDVWGRIRRSVESSVAGAQASAGDIASIRLSVQSTLASDYFSLRGADALQRLLNDTVKQYEQSLKITENQFAVGVLARLDVITALALLQTTRAQAIAAGVQRAQFEHAIATLIGHPPADLTIDTASLAKEVPIVPLALPSALLERRPDIAAQERRIQQQNALIGVDVAAFYPSVVLSASAGYVGNPVTSLISLANRFWSLGTAAADPLFMGGLRRATVSAALASYDIAVATYRQTVLLAFQQIEDALSTLRLLEQEENELALAVKSTQEATQIAINEYQGGTVSYLSVITAEAIQLSDEIASLTVQQNRLLASVGLVVALGGGWDVSQLPTPDELQSWNPIVP